jgi:hypothetical protein
MGLDNNTVTPNETRSLVVIESLCVRFITLGKLRLLHLVTGQVTGSGRESDSQVRLRWRARRRRNICCRPGVLHGLSHVPRVRHHRCKRYNSQCHLTKIYIGGVAGSLWVIQSLVNKRVSANEELDLDRGHAFIHSFEVNTTDRVLSRVIHFCQYTQRSVLPPGVSTRIVRVAVKSKNIMRPQLENYK